MSTQNIHTSNSTLAPCSPGISDKGLLRGSIALAIISLIGLGLLYPLTGVGLNQVLFPEMANGSLIERDGKVVGSELVAQPFSDARYFQPRPSAANYDVMAVAGSNQARTNPDLRDRIDKTRTSTAQHNSVDPSAIPGDLITQSGSGVDAHLSPDAVALQADRVARARGIGLDVIKGLLALHTENKQFGLLGQPRVNILKLNMSLDALAYPAAEISKEEP